MTKKILTYIKSEIRKYQWVISLSLFITCILTIISMLLVPSEPKYLDKYIDLREFALMIYTVMFLYVSPISKREEIGKIITNLLLLIASPLAVLLGLIGLFSNKSLGRVIGSAIVLSTLSVFLITAQKALRYLNKVFKRISKKEKKKKTISITVFLSSLISTLSVILSFIKLIVETFVKLAD